MNDMIAVIQGSNRQSNTTRTITQFLAEQLRTRGEAVEVVDLVELRGEVLHPEMYAQPAANEFLDRSEQVLLAADKWLIAFPEYNGSFPGALKLFIDALSIRDYKKLFGNKKTALIGTASGRAGNLRGLDHMTAVLHHLGSVVMPQALPISLIDSKLEGESKALTDAATQTILTAYLDRFLAFGEA